MVSLASHMLVGLSIGLALYRRSPAAWLICTVAAIFPDVDVFILHRAALHNIFAVVTAIVVTALLLRQCAGGTFRRALVAAAGAMLSHVFLDVISGPVQLLYPVSLAEFELLDIWPYIELSVNNVVHVMLVDKLSIVLLLLPILLALLRRQH